MGLFLTHAPNGAGFASRTIRRAHVSLVSQLPDNVMRNWCRGGGGIDDVVSASVGAGADEGTLVPGVVVVW